MTILAPLTKFTTPSVLMFICLATSACNASRTVSESESLNPATQKQAVLGAKDWNTADCVTPSAISDLLGKAEAHVPALLGEPDKEEQFTIGEGMREFRIELLNQFPQMENLARVIIERNWSGDKCNLTIWLSDKGDGQVVVDIKTWSVENIY